MRIYYRASISRIRLQGVMAQSTIALVHAKGRTHVVFPFVHYTPPEQFTAPTMGLRSSSTRI